MKSLANVMLRVAEGIWRPLNFFRKRLISVFFKNTPFVDYTLYLLLIFQTKIYQPASRSKFLMGARKYLKNVLGPFNYQMSFK